MKNIINLSAILSIILVAERDAHPWCFILPQAITYGNRGGLSEGSKVSALNAGAAESSRSVPILSDLMNGRIIMANIISIQGFELQVTVNGVVQKIAIGKAQAVGLTLSKKALYVMSVSPVNSNDSLKAETDLWAKGNWTSENNFDVRTLDMDGTAQPTRGGYIRVTPLKIIALGGEATQIAIVNIKHKAPGMTLTTNYASSQLVPNLAAEAPFSSAVFSKVPVVEDCQVTATCPILVSDDAPMKQPLTFEWSLKRIQ